MNLQKLNPWRWVKLARFSNIPTKRGETARHTITPNSHPITQLKSEISQLYQDTFHNFGFPSTY